MSNVEMMSDIGARLPSAERTTRAKPLEYRLVFGVCFIVFLWAIALEHMMPRRWRQISGAGAQQSLLAEVKEAAHRCTGIAFQG